MSTNFAGPFEQEKFQMSIGGDFGVFIQIINHQFLY